MGLFKGMKDMKDAVAGAPGMIDQAQQMQANAAAYQANMGMAGGVPQPIDPNDPILAPINGIDLMRYAQLSKAIGHYQLKTQEQIDAYMQSGGHSPEDWQAAYDGWNERFKANMSLSSLYAQYFGSVTFA
jgi:acyl-homoserine lactone acylase PvdQ